MHIIDYNYLYCRMQGAVPPATPTLDIKESSCIHGKIQCIYMCWQGRSHHLGCRGYWKTDPEGDGVANTSNVSEDGVVGAEGEHDPYFEPVVTLPEIQVKTNEEEEEEMIKLRCKLFRYHTSETPAEWKERGTGDVKILRHSSKKTVSLLSESYDFWVATVSCFQNILLVSTSCCSVSAIFRI
ncbi:uncharacterized protein LOC134772336 [Penaeus indicus]|uniref:uncharacterized protein LOC134772336 n=1 Tax=Penaeus indicus TaxID=29960 RepID=UPI00300C0647